ncbi:MAG: MAPEG family protein [Pseudomonadota bacterium]|nr:MAPEG family protein [Pseudomonadota bacterium]
MTTLPITLTIAGAAAIMNVWLGIRVSLLRRRHGVSIGDGGKTQIATRARAHANYVEYTPFFLVLLALVELARGSEPWLWLVATLFIIGRLAHPLGMDRPGANLLRVAGIAITWLSLLTLAAVALATSYAEQAKPKVSYAAVALEGTKLS